MDMLFYNLCILTFCIGFLKAAVIKDSFKDEGGGSSYPNSASDASILRKNSERHIHFEYPIEKPHPGNEYVKISILSNSKLPNPLPDPRLIWNKTISYIIYKRSSSKEKSLILNVIQSFNTETCLKFVEGNNDDDIFITITPNNRLTHSLCRTREHKRNLRKIKQGIFYDLKFILDFGLTEIYDRKIWNHGTSLNSDIRKLNEFYNCEEKAGLSYQKKDNYTRILIRKKRNLENIYAQNIASLPPETDFYDGYILRRREEEIEDVPSDQIMAEIQEILKGDILPTVAKPVIEGNDSSTLPPSDNKSITLGKSIRANERSTGVTDPTRVTRKITTDKDTTSSITEEQGIAINVATSTRSKDSTPSNAFPATVTDNPASSSAANTNNGISSTAANDGKTSASSSKMEVTSGSTGDSSAVTQPVNSRRGDTGIEKESNESIKADPSSVSSRKREFSKGGKELILSEDKVIVVDEQKVLEHEIGTEHQHLHGPTGLLTLDEDEEHDGFHQVDVVDGNLIKGRTALKDPSKLWTEGVIPFVLSDEYDNRQKQLVIEGMEEFHNKTCVRFVKRTNEKSYIFLKPDSRCSATIGKIEGGVNNVTISDGCFIPGIIVHELMHVMGFIHEQNRPDRDSYVMIMWSNIIPKTKGNFRKYRKNDVQDFGQGYDYDSIMHYGMYDFAIDLERPTIIPLKPGINIGQRDGFSKKDLIKVNKLFRCDEPAEDVGGTNEGYEIEFRRRPKTTVPRNDFKKSFLRFLKKIFKAIFLSLQTFGSVQI